MADAGKVSARSALGGVTVPGGFDAPVDPLPGLVVGAGIVDADVAVWRVSVEPSVLTGSAAEGGVQCRVDPEPGSSGDGGLVDPVPDDRLGEDVGCGFVVAGDDVGVIGVASAGQRRVDTAAIDRAVDEEEPDIDGAALGGVAGLGIAELEGLGGVIGGRDCTMPVRPATVTAPSGWMRSMVQRSRFLTMIPRSVRRARWLRRVTTSSPTSSRCPPRSRAGPFGSSS